MKTALLAALAATTALVPGAASAATLLYEGSDLPGGTVNPAFRFTIDTGSQPTFVSGTSVLRYNSVFVTFTRPNGTQISTTTGVNFSFATNSNGTASSQAGFLNITPLNFAVIGQGNFSVVNEFFTAGTNLAPTLLTGTFNVSSMGTGTPDNYVVRVTDISAVPEPATWVVLILGFGMVGGAMRRHGTVRLLSA